MVTYDKLNLPPPTELNTQEGGGSVISGLTQAYIPGPEVKVLASMVQKSCERAYNQDFLKSGRISSAIQTSIWHPIVKA